MSILAWPPAAAAPQLWACPDYLSYYPNASQFVPRELQLFTGAQPWAHVRAAATASGGGLHLHEREVFSFNASSARVAATFARAHQLRLSVEAGGSMCGAPAAAAAAVLQKFGPFLAAGGVLAQYALESIFSRSVAACPEATLAQLANHTAAYARAIHDGMLRAGAPAPEFGLIDAVPHFWVNTTRKSYPPNPAFRARYHDWSLPAVIDALSAAMKAQSLGEQVFFVIK